MADSDMPSFKEVNWEQQEKEDELALQNLLANPEQPGQNEGLFDQNRPLDAGEKADDAQDFEDISDDDLPDEEEATGGKDDEAPGLTDDVDMGLDDDDDLFGDNQASTPYDHFDDNEIYPGHGETAHANGGFAMPPADPVEEVADLRALNFPEHGTDAPQDDTPADYEGDLEFIRRNWPQYDKDAAINLNELFPPRHAHFIPKVPVKLPKPVNPTKVSLDLAGDQEKTYRVAGAAKPDKSKWIVEAEAKGLVPIVDESSEEAESDNEFDFTPLDRNQKVGGLSMLDIEVACADWESIIDRQIPTPPVEEEEVEEPMDEWEREILGHSAKRKRVQVADFTICPIYPTPSFDSFEQMAAQVAKRVELDLNDPYLLVDIQEPQVTKRRRIGLTGNSKATGNGLASKLSARFNISNDDAYEALKENHQSKVRATLGNISVEHSLPAQKLQWPYYQIALPERELRVYHRPTLKVGPAWMNTPISFEKPGGRKKKTVKNLPTIEVFKESGDLSLADHYSSATLLEYSEEHPTVLSNFGMGNRIINYYRRKDANDLERPVPEDKVGDVTILLPEDRSPFANFGMVDAGETVRAIHNQMYRAPIFKHEPQNTDFLVVRTHTGVGGYKWYIRNIDNVFVVGQQFPSVEIPGPHSRKVTNAQKNRMKMIAYRKIRHSKDQHLKIGEITRHIPGSVDMQNRQKLKEFMTYDKAEKVWRMRSGDIMPDEASIRSMVKPEEVCVIDAMQVGVKQLSDAGYVEEENKAEEEQSLDQKLAPWSTTKAFLEASADKAMLQLHGEGDPTGKGSAFSFIKTSMKGGYLEAIQHGPMSSAATRMAKDPKANNGHTYNVKAQQTIYNDAIRRIWDQQKSELSYTQIPEFTAEEKARIEEPDDEVAPSPAAVDDENASVLSHRSGKTLKITRTKKNKEVEVIFVKNERVINKYLEVIRKRKLENLESVYIANWILLYANDAIVSTNPRKLTTLR
jgi:hypothetical protein